MSLCHNFPNCLNCHDREKKTNHSHLLFECWNFKLIGKRVVGNWGERVKETIMSHSVQRAKKMIPLFMLRRLNDSASSLPPLPRFSHFFRCANDPSNNKKQAKNRKFLLHFFSIKASLVHSYCTTANCFSLCDLHAERWTMKTSREDKRLAIWSGGNLHCSR